MPPPDYVTNASPAELTAARLLYEDVVAAVNPLYPPQQISVLRILWHSLRDRYPVYAAHADAADRTPLPATEAVHATTES